MAYLPSKLGKHAPAKTLRLICQVCGGKGWVRAFPVLEVNPAAEVTHETNPRIDEHSALTVPCFACPTYPFLEVS